MGDGSVDITAWIQRMVKESGLSSVRLQFHNSGTSGVATETKAKEEKLERAEKPIKAPIATTKETPRPSEWKDLDTLLFPEDKEG